jgi:hypothetical protein
MVVNIHRFYKENMMFYWQQFGKRAPRVNIARPNDETALQPWPI